jgi:tripeptide aminopeptidase
VLLGLSESLGESNLGGIREFLNNWRRPIRAAVILEGAELGRLNYFSRAMIRADINCEIPMISGWENKYGSNAILIMNDIINRILEIHLPQRPNTQIILGKIKGGIKHGDLALSSRLGLEIESTSDELVQEIYSKIEDIVDSIRHENLVDLRMNQISNVNASRLEYTHPLVKTAVAILEGLKVKPVIESSESELSIFLSHNIPAITVGVTHGENYHTENAQIEIEPMFAGIAQLIGLIEAIDKGIIDEQ